MKIVPIQLGREFFNGLSNKPSRRARSKALIGMESLEDRRVFAVSTWSGAVNGLWSNAGNWDVAPVAGDDLVFPSTAAQFTTQNDLASGLSFGNITFSGSSYNLGGNSLLLTGTISSTVPIGTDTIGLDINFTGPANINVAQANANLALAGAVTAAGGLTKTGTGLLTLSGTSSFDGNITVNAGTLKNNTDVNGNILVNSFAFLFGDGTSNSITSTAGNVQPGANGTGLLTSTGDLTLDSGSGYIIALNGTIAGTNYGQVQVGGLVTLANATLSASLGYTPTGNQSFTVLNNTGNLPISGTFSGLPEGSNLTLNGQNFKVSYVGGDGNDIVLNRTMATSTTLTSSANPSVSGQSINLTAKITASLAADGTPTGSVNFFSGTTAIGSATVDGSGDAVLSLSTLPVGNSTISAVFNGTNGFSNSTSANLTQVVNKATSLTTVTTSPNPSGYGQSVILSANISAVSPGSGTPTGTVTFLSGNTTLGTATLDANGSGSVTTSSIAAGTSSITASYSGDNNFTAANSTALSQVVNKATPNVTLTVSTTNPGASGLITLTANLANSFGNGNLPTGSVDFYSNGVKIGSGSITAGSANFTTTGFYLGIGLDSITADYTGDGNYSTATSAAANVTAGTDDERFLNAAYLVIFNRQADYQGLNAWNTYLQHGRTRNWVARQMRQSTAGQQALIEDIFTSYLGRTGTPSELNGTAAAALATGTSPRAVVLGSKEYFNGQGGGSIPTYIKAMEATLNTTFSPYAFEAMTQELVTGTLPVKVAQEALNSQAGTVSLADVLYQTTLGRAPTSQEVDQFFSLRNKGIYWRFQQSHLMGTQEFLDYALSLEGSPTEV